MSQYEFYLVITMPVPIISDFFSCLGTDQIFVSVFLKD